MFFRVLDASFSVGTVVEIEWAIQNKKPIIIFYKADQGKKYDFRSEYWFVIADVKDRAQKSLIVEYTLQTEVVNAVLQGNVFKDLLSIE